MQVGIRGRLTDKMKRFLLLSLLFSLLSCACIGYNSFVLYKNRINANGPRGVSTQETAFALDYPMIDSMTDSQKTAFALGYPAYMTAPQETAFALGYPARTTNPQNPTFASGYPPSNAHNPQNPTFASGYPARTTNPQNPTFASGYPARTTNPQNPTFASGYPPSNAQDPVGPEDQIFEGGSPNKLSTNNLCRNSAFSDEVLILIGTDPAPGQAIGPDGVIRVWVTDEGAPKIAPGEIVDPDTGKITTPGDRTATDGRGKGFYLWEPALYITAITSANERGPYSGNAEDGGKPYFPSMIKGDYNPLSDFGIFSSHQYHGPPVDDYTKFENGPSFKQTDNIGFAWSHAFTAEYIWDVNSLKIPHGVYHAEIVTHDGDVNLSVDCIAVRF